MIKNLLISRFLTLFLAIAVVLVCAGVSSIAPVHADDSGAGDSSDSSQVAPDTSTPDSSVSEPTSDDTSGDPSTAPDDSQATTPDTSGDTSTGTSDTSTTDASSTDPSITTGDADSAAETDSTVNTNTADASTTDPTTVDNNNADVTTDASSTADTGDNTDTTDNADVTVTTGNAIATNNVINVVNTNLFNSNGLLEFINAIEANGFNFDDPSLTSLFDTDSDSTDCSLMSCDSGTLSVTNNNTANVTNTLDSVATTGGNTASTSDSSITAGNATITTGNAYASGNLVNVVNTNITNSNYLLIALNNFGDLGGDITLPGADFFEQLLNGSAQQDLNTSIQNNNTANVTNTTNASADTGDNAASSSDSTDITTGNAVSGATTVNQVNTNFTNGSTVYMLVNVIGNWTGTVQGLPAGLSWTQTPTGIAITGNSNALGTLGAPDTTDVSNNNTANVTNNVNVYALTGQNSATGGNTNISTGDADASANVVNIVNTNVLGENWILAIFNIFGNWNGNLAFGQPDLWIGAAAETPNPTPGGGTVTYDFTVSNHGDADATNVVLTANYDKTLLSFASTSDETDVPSGTSWDLGTIPEGQTKDFTYTATAGDVPSGASSVDVPLTATVTEDETDANLTDNTDQVTIQIADPMGSFPVWQVTPPNITLNKTADVSTTTAPSSVNYNIDLENNGGPLYNAVLTDTLKDPKGSVVYTQSWNFDEVDTGDEDNVAYSIDYNASTTPGVYTNTAVLTGEENTPTLGLGATIAPISSTASVDVLPPGQVLGAFISDELCAPLLTSYIQPGGKNDPTQVTALQEFLSDYEHDNVPINGVYDDATQIAVKNFQQKYASEILTPWGETAPTGFVYYTTEEKVNEIYCQGSMQFPLSQAQMQEIATYKIHTSREGHALTPATLSTRKTKLKLPTKLSLKTPPSVAVLDSTTPESLAGAPKTFFTYLQGIFSATTSRI